MRDMASWVIFSLCMLATFILQISTSLWIASFGTTEGLVAANSGFLLVYAVIISFMWLT